MLCLGGFQFTIYHCYERQAKNYTSNNHVYCCCMVFWHGQFWFSGLKLITGICSCYTVCVKQGIRWDFWRCNGGIKRDHETLFFDGFVSNNDITSVLLCFC